MSLCSFFMSDGKRSSGPAPIYFDVKSQTPLHMNEYSVFIPVSERGLSVEQPKISKTGEFPRVKPKAHESFTFQPVKFNSKKTKQENPPIQVSPTQSYFTTINTLIQYRLAKIGMKLDNEAQDLIVKTIFQYLIQIIKSSIEISHVRLDMGGDTNRLISFNPYISNYAYLFEANMLNSARNTQFAKNKDLAEFFKDHIPKEIQLPAFMKDMKDLQSHEGLLLVHTHIIAEENALARFINTKINKVPDDGVAQQFRDKINKTKSSLEETKRTFKSSALEDLKRTEELEVRRANPSLISSDILTCIQTLPNFEFIAKQVSLLQHFKE